MERLRKRLYRGFDFAERIVRLWRASGRYVIPSSHAPQRPVDAILVLHRTGNPTSAYYLESRLAHSARPVIWADIERPPSLYPEIQKASSLLVIVCRYIRGRWLTFLEQERARIGQCVYFTDDDMPALLSDHSLSPLVRGKIAAWYAPHIRRLESLCDEAWVSTSELASRMQLPTRVLPPLPTEDAPPPQAESNLVCYHSTDSHRAERAFVIAVARAAQAQCPQAFFEITGDAIERRLAEGLTNVRIVPQRDWTNYRDDCLRGSAAIGLAPLFPTRVNLARSHVKAFDIARLGAAGLFADAEPYQGYVKDGQNGLLLIMETQAWADAISRLLAQPARRVALVEDARRTIAEARRSSAEFSIR